MTKILRSTSLCRLGAVLLIGTVIVSALDAAAATEATLTAVSHDASVIVPNRRANPASLGRRVDAGQLLRTGRRARAELTFAGSGLLRLSSDTTVALEGRQQVQLKEGAVLCDVAVGQPHLNVHTADIAAEIAGTTAILECRAGFFKFLVLTGTGRLYRPRHFGDSVLVPAGEMVFGKPEAALTDPVDFDLGRFVQTSVLFRSFPPLRSRNLIASAIQDQQREKSKKGLVATNLAIFGGGSTVSLLRSPNDDGSQPQASPSASKRKRNRKATTETH